MQDVAQSIHQPVAFLDALRQALVLLLLAELAARLQEHGPEARARPQGVNIQRRHPIL
jgi:hypothetical protein